MRNTITLLGLFTYTFLSLVTIKLLFPKGHTLIQITCFTYVYIFLFTKAFKHSATTIFDNGKIYIFSTDYVNVSHLISKRNSDSIPNNTNRLVFKKETEGEYSEFRN